mmetsp:Transcript_20678/g.61736  ORF Transcript_20678/g.61736 Transcript_20678/m.61736 type:complete len:242 (-) Transcript_20678:357-1082(-)
MGSSSAAYPPLPGAHLEKIAEEHAVVFNALVRQLLGQLCGRLPAHTREQHHDVGRSARQACKSALPEEQDLLHERVDLALVGRVLGVVDLCVHWHEAHAGLPPEVPPRQEGRRRGRLGHIDAGDLGARRMRLHGRRVEHCAHRCDTARADRHHNNRPAGLHSRCHVARRVEHGCKATPDNLRHLDECARAVLGEHALVVAAMAACDDLDDGCVTVRRVAPALVRAGRDVVQLRRLHAVATA